MESNWEARAMKFSDRTAAGWQLADLVALSRPARPIVIGLARGGVAVAAPVAERLGAPLDTIVVRKIGHPFSPELAIGAVTDAGLPAWGSSLDAAGHTWRSAVAADEQANARHLQRRYRGGRPPMSLEGATAILVDDGIATGMSMLAAARAARRRGAARVVAAAPVASPGARHQLATAADLMAVLIEPSDFVAVGQYYEQFEPVTDEAIRLLLEPAGETREPLDLPSLNAVLATVRDYPASSAQLAHRARELRAPASVVAFFESVGGTFQDKADVINRSALTEMILEQEANEPDEDEHVIAGD
jgi:putative phosphoribosyl transferase